MSRNPISWTQLRSQLSWSPFPVRLQGPDALLAPWLEGELSFVRSGPAPPLLRQRHSRRGRHDQGASRIPGPPGPGLHTPRLRSPSPVLPRPCPHGHQRALRIFQDHGTVTEQRATKPSAATGSFVDGHMVRLWLIECCRSSEPPLRPISAVAGP
jgi:hypothetical protein